MSTMDFFRFDPIELPEETEALRMEVRAFLADELKDRPLSGRGQTWSGSDIAFSRKMGGRG
jgi:hypothetical protein